MSIKKDTKVSGKEFNKRIKHNQKQSFWLNSQQVARGLCER